MMYPQPFRQHARRGHGIAIGFFQCEVNVLSLGPFLGVGLAGTGGLGAGVGDADGGGGGCLGVEGGVEDCAEGAVDEGSGFFGGGCGGEDFGGGGSFCGVEGVELGDEVGGEDICEGGEIDFCLRRRSGLNKRQLRFLDGGTFAGFSPLELRSCLGFDGESDWVFFSTMTFPSNPTSFTTKSSYLLSIPIN